MAVLFGALFCLVQPARAQQDAFKGTLSQYLGLDNDGVTIGDAIFSNFQVLPLQEGASGFRLDFIDVVPLFDDPIAPGFRFEIMDGATADDFFELRFSFDVSGAFYDEVALSIDQVNILSSSNAGADVLLDLSMTGGTTGGLGSAVAFAGPGGEGDLTASESFSSTDQLTVEFDAVIDGGGEGRPGEVIAQIGSATVRVGQSEIQPTGPIVIRGFGSTEADPETFFIEFFGSPTTNHVIKGSSILTDGFPAAITLTAGSGQTDASGFARVEFNVNNFEESYFFRVETSL